MNAWMQTRSHAINNYSKQMSKKEQIPDEIASLVNKTTKANMEQIKKIIENVPSYIHATKDITNTFLSFTNKIAANPDEISKVQQTYLDFIQQQIELWKSMTERHKDNDYEPVIAPAKDDKRFCAPEWEEYPFHFDFIKQNYLLISQLMMGIVNAVELDDTTKKKLTFYTQLFVDALSPANFIATNPEAIKLAWETKGQSLIDGYKNLLADIEKGRITQTDSSTFEVGKNLAITPGGVVFENELIQLIQYTPANKKVKELPLLIIPPWINRYYILDLEPEKSYVKFAVDEGYTVFMISWRVPKGDMGHLTFDDYVEMGALKAIEVIRNIMGVEKINTLGYCIGGTLLGVVLAILRAKRKTFVNSATFLATMLDFSDIGALGALVDEALVEKFENDLKDGGMLKGEDMSTSFNIIRANDLIWKYVVNNYLKGKKPTPFSILYWTNDNTNLPGKMYAYYLRNIVLENKLPQKNALTIADTPIDLSKIDMPAYVIGTSEDHISPCKTAFITTELLHPDNKDIEFVLGEAGHVVGIINPPSKNKYGHFINGKLGHGFEKWLETAKLQKGSWWKHWSNWLGGKSGKLIAPPAKLGNKEYPVIEPAPGRYVKEPL